jgi:uncharacterized protein
MKNKNLIALLLAVLFIQTAAYAQKANTKEDKKGLFWEISGKNLKKPSYLYGTFHLLNQDYLDSLKGWQDKLRESKVIVGEVIMDSSKMQQLYASMIMKDNTLDKLLSQEEYQKTAAFLKDVSGYDLQMFNTFKPMALSTFLTILAWTKNNPSGYNPQKAAMDVYFQNLGKQQNKELKALETVEQQSAMLFDNFSLQRQKEMLVAMVQDKDKTLASLIKMDKCYRAEDLVCMQESMYSKEWNFTEDDMNKLITNRNKEWIPKLSEIMEKEPAFIAVGAGHLPGKEGVINLLRQKGYTVKQIELKN